MLTVRKKLFETGIYSNLFCTFASDKETIKHQRYDIQSFIQGRTKQDV